MAESIALGMRLATADELATAAGIEGEISVTEGEWRAVVHDGVTKGGYPLAKLAEAGYSLTKSEDGTKLQLKNKNGVVLSETDAPASSSGVHVGNEAPTDEKADIWLDLDEDSPTIEVDTSNLVPKTGDRGNLAGYERFNATFDIESTSPATLTINESSSDVSFAIANNVVVENGVDIGFLPFYVGSILGENPPLFSPDAVSWTKVVLLLVESTVTLGTRWIWANNELPDITPGGLLILHWNAEFGVANFLSFNGAFDEMCGKYVMGEL